MANRTNATAVNRSHLNGFAQVMERTGFCIMVRYAGFLSQPW